MLFLIDFFKKKCEIFPHYVCCFHSSSLPPEASVLKEKPYSHPAEDTMVLFAGFLEHSTMSGRRIVLLPKDFSHALCPPFFPLPCLGLEFACLIHLLAIFELA